MLFAKLRKLRKILQYNNFRNFRNCDLPENQIVLRLRPTLRKLNCVICEIAFLSQSILQPVMNQPIIRILPLKYGCSSASNALILLSGL